MLFLGRLGRGERIGSGRLGESRYGETLLRTKIRLGLIGRVIGPENGLFFTAETMGS